MGRVERRAERRQALAKAESDSKKEPAKDVSNALAFQEERDGVRVQTNISFIGPAAKVKAAMVTELEKHGG
jgi:hypothetical protein